MTDKELKRLSRIELLEIISMLQRSQKKLTEENSRLRAALEDRRQILTRSFSFERAAKELDDAINQVRSAAQQYQFLLENESARVVSILCGEETEET